MRLAEDVGKCIVFVGHGALDHFDPVGTAFLVVYDSLTYLVTAKHIAAQLGDDPFDLSFTNQDGVRHLVHIDLLERPPHQRWHHHPDDAVDIVAVLVLAQDMVPEINAAMIPPSVLMKDERKAGKLSVDEGDFCYAAGLFKRHHGKKRNIPVIHTGHIALMPSDELIETSEGKLLRGYLCEITNLRGLSGSPVFVRPSVQMNFGNWVPAHKGRRFSLSTGEVYLLGVWAASWEGVPADEALADNRVPVGMGVVTPCAYLIEILESPIVAGYRKLALAVMAAQEKTQLDEG